jgi:ATP-dependent DNA ligase
VSQLRRDVATKFKGLQTDTCPFANLPERKRTQWALTKEEMKNCVWLRPTLVAQIEFTEWTPDGHLRHSKFVGLREDKGKINRRVKLCGRDKNVGQILCVFDLPLYAAF